MILGLDTSCYTTSVALISLAGEIIADQRSILQVPKGERGLRQSDAVFQHIQNLPRLVETLECQKQLSGVVVSSRPRPLPDSYMPVFKVGVSYGEFLGRLLQLPVLATSHQEGHLRAGFFPGEALSDPFLAWHLSGGTTELLLVSPDKSGYRIEKLGGSQDLAAGQFVDRLGVSLGLPFPAGPHLEALAVKIAAKSGLLKTKLPSAVQGLTLSFSGPESAAQRLVSQKVPEAEIAHQVFDCIGRSLLKVTCQGVQKYGIRKVLLVGGVAANSIIRNYLQTKGEKEGISFQFGRPQLAADNAVGLALLGWDQLNKNK